ncbi:CLC3A protein, partial [Polypterus senegalus]
MLSLWIPARHSGHYSSLEQLCRVWWGAPEGIPHSCFNGIPMTQKCFHRAISQHQKYSQVWDKRSCLTSFRGVRVRRKWAKGGGEEEKGTRQHGRICVYCISVATVEVCLRGTKVHRKCYLAIDVPKHFHEANEDCIAQGGTLVTPRDADENTSVRDYAKKSLPGAKDFWIGITDMVKEGHYVDVNGMAINYFNWDRSKSQPTGVKRESCVMMSQASQGKWHDDVCRNLKKYICEYIIP